MLTTYYVLALLVKKKKSAHRWLGCKSRAGNLRPFAKLNSKSMSKAKGNSVNHITIALASTLYSRGQGSGICFTLQPPLPASHV